MSLADPHHGDNLRFEITSLYISLLRYLKPSIAATHSSDPEQPPPFEDLDVRFKLFLQNAVNLDDEAAQWCWKSLKHIAWATEGARALAPDLTVLLPIFLEHGLPLQTGLFELYPPTRVCITPGCPLNPMHRKPTALPPPNLGEPSRHEITVFTRDLGAVPGYSTSTYCRGCLTRYHHDHSVMGNVRTYYSSRVATARKFMIISTHFYMETELAERFATQMVMAWTSMQNCARIYNTEAHEHPWAVDLPNNWSITFEMDYEHATEAFITHCLLDWHHTQGTELKVPHRAPNQRARFHDALQARNIALSGTGQPEWNHACSRCTKIIKNEAGEVTGAIRSVVVDGISLGHPCCAVHDSKEPLANNKHHYCPTHANLHQECAVEDCRAPSETKFRTCAIPTHRAAETRYIARSKAMFQLKERLAKSHAGNTTPVDFATPSNDPQEADDDAAVPDDDVEVLQDEEGNVIEIESCSDKPESGVRKVFARFGRRRTHNDQLCVASCGVILGRATFYGAEGPNSVRIFLKILFPTKSALPTIIWFDNNCKLAAMLAKDNDTYFENVALPVDVFHFKTKHKESDTYCGLHCNPAQWPELMDPTTGEWVFNSSAAEQVNLWYGGFYAITRLMRADRYNFLLDEMVMRRNRFIISQLEAAGCAPYSIPRHELLRPDV